MYCTIILCTGEPCHAGPGAPRPGPQPDRRRPHPAHHFTAPLAIHTHLSPFPPRRPFHRHSCATAVAALSRPLQAGNAIVLHTRAGPSLSFTTRLLSPAALSPALPCAPCTLAQRASARQYLQLARPFVSPPILSCASQEPLSDFSTRSGSHHLPIHTWLWLPLAHALSIATTFSRGGLGARRAGAAKAHDGCCWTGGVACQGSSP